VSVKVDIVFVIEFLQSSDYVAVFLEATCVIKIRIRGLKYFLILKHFASHFNHYYLLLVPQDVMSVAFSALENILRTIFCGFIPMILN
jgi:hypothetical protein